MATRTSYRAAYCAPHVLSPSIGQDELTRHLDFQFFLRVDLPVCQSFVSFGSVDRVAYRSWKIGKIKRKYERILMDAADFLSQYDIRQRSSGNIKNRFKRKARLLLRIVSVMLKLFGCPRSFFRFRRE